MTAHNLCESESLHRFKDAQSAIVGTSNSGTVPVVSPTCTICTNSLENNWLPAMASVSDSPSSTDRTMPSVAAMKAPFAVAFRLARRLSSIGMPASWVR